MAKKMISLGNLKTFRDNMYLAVYPVGSIYTSVDIQNPGMKFGGTWAPKNGGQKVQMGNPAIEVYVWERTV